MIYRTLKDTKVHSEPVTSLDVFQLSASLSLSFIVNKMEGLGSVGYFAHFVSDRSIIKARSKKRTERCV